MERKKKLEQLYNELSNTRVQMVTGGSTENPYKIRTIKRTIARIKTIEREQEAQGL
jgi:large subunit ribosomal protein L29